MEVSENSHYGILRILIVEDNPADAELIEYDLRGAGFVFQSIIVETKQAYIKALSDFCPDIILSDYDLPSFTGADALRIKKEKCRDVPFVLITGAVGEERAIEILTGGATDYVLKSNLSRLVPAVRRALHEAYEHRKRKEAEAERDSLLKNLEERVLERTEALEIEIGERKDIESRLRESEHRYRSLFEQNFDAVFMVDTEGRFLSANPACERISGYTREELLNMSFPQLCAPDQLEKARKRFESTLKGGIQELEMAIVRKDGRRVELLLTGGTLKVEGRTESLYAIAKDITERKRAEEALRESEERFRVLVEAASQAVWETDAQGYVVRDSPTWRAYTGQTLQEWLGCGWLDAVHPDDRAIIEKQWPKVVAEGSKVNAEFRLRGPDGTWRWTHVRAAPIRNADGTIAKWVGMNADITERKRRELNASLLAEIDRVFASTSSADEIMQAAGSKIGEHLDMSNCFFTEINEATDQVLVLYSWQRIMRFPDITGASRLSAFVNEDFRTAARAGKIIVIRDTRTDSRTEGAGYADYNIHAYVTVPFHRGGQWKFLFTVNHSTPRDWREDEIELIREVANRTFPRLEQARAEAALRESEERYRLIFESSMDGILFTRPDGSIISANSAAQKILGRTENEIIEGGREQVSDLSDPRLGPALEERARTGKFFGELNYKRKDGTIFPVEVSSTLFRNAEGRTFSSIIFRDVSWRKEAERILKESEQRFREMADAIPHLVWTGTPDGQIDYFNRRRGEFPGLTRDASGIWHWAEDLIHPEDFSKTIEFWQTAVETKTGSRIEHRIRDKSGNYRWYLTRYLPVRDSGGNVIRWIGTTTDIHDLKEAETNLKNRTKQLEETNKELESFSYSVSHDLRAPLRAIDGFSGMLLQEEQSLGQEAKRKIRIIRGNTVKMDRLINDLLDLSRSGRASMSRRKVDMTRLLNIIWQEQVSANTDRKMELKQGTLPEAFGDEALLRQVLANLLANAVKFTRRKKAAVIEIEGKSEGRENIYAIKDNGTGFDMKYYDKLFGVFQRLHPESDYEGTGVGLAIVQRIIHRHGGRVWAESKIGKGATFYFSLPVAQEQ